MAKKDCEREKKQRKWEQEKDEIENRWKKAPQVKARLRNKGCILPFYDLLDPYEAEFKKVVAWAKAEFRSLHDVFEVNPAEFDSEDSLTQLGLPEDWTQVQYECDDELAASYTARDPKSNARGVANGFHDASGELHTIIRVVRSPACGYEHKKHKYVSKMPVLLHEIGHVKDFEGKINFDHDSKTADIIEGEVYAHLFSLNECFRRAYFMSAGLWLDSLTAYKDSTDYRGEVTRRLLTRFQMPAYRPWTDYGVT